MKALWMMVGVAFAGMVSALTPETAALAKAARDKGLDALVRTQSAEGHWSDRRFPGMSALAMKALAESGDARYAEAVERAVKYIVSCAQPDGGIYVAVPGRIGAGLGNYNTCLCLTALFTSGHKEQYMDILLGARSYIASTQLATSGLHEGGFGYDRNTERPYSDLNNTFYAMDAMKTTRSLEESRPLGQKKVDINWEKARQYVLAHQVTDGAEEGGFVYKQEVPRRTPQGVKAEERLRATGSMTYAGLLAMLHCELNKGEPRVRSTLQFLGKHWSLDENYGQGVQGLYFYYMVIARALDAAGVETLTLEDGTTVDWREALAQAVLKRQREDGSWRNDNNRFWEGDPTLATAYAVLVLELVLR